MKNKSAQSLKRRRKNKTGTTRKAQISEFESRICVFSLIRRGPFSPRARSTPSEENNSNFIYTAGKKRTWEYAEGPSGKIRRRLSAGRFYWRQSSERQFYSTRNEAVEQNGAHSKVGQDKETGCESFEFKGEG